MTSSTDPDPSLVFAQTLPDQPSAADLEQGGDDEQSEGAQDGHLR
jgi:hypothetical protein